MKKKTQRSPTAAEEALLLSSGPSKAIGRRTFLKGAPATAPLFIVGSTLLLPRQAGSEFTFLMNHEPGGTSRIAARTAQGKPLSRNGPKVAQAAARPRLQPAARRFYTWDPATRTCRLLIFS